MRSASLFAVAALAVVLMLSSAQNVFAVPQITLNPTCGSPGTRVSYGATGTGDWYTTKSIDPTNPFSGVSGCIACDGVNVWCEYCGATVGGDALPGLYTITYTDETGSASVTFSIPCPAVGGVVAEPVNTLGILAPWLAVIGLVGCVATVAIVVRKRRP